MPLLEVTDLSVEYAGKTVANRVVHKVSFAVEKGERVAIVGESGSGKSTTAHALLNLLPQGGKTVGGSIRLDGQELTDLSEAAWPTVRGKLIGLVPQDPGVGLNPVTKIGAQIAEAVSQHAKMPKALARARAIELLTEVGIPEARERAEQYPHELSGGMRQRVLIAIAIASSPQLIIADEPTSALDVTVQRKILDLLDKEVTRSQAALLFITHDLSVAAARSDRIIVMKDGEIVEQGPTQQLLDNPTHEYTKALLAADPLNLNYREVPRPTEVVLEVNNISKTFALRGDVQGVQAVSNATFSVNKGQTLAIVGESGSGKSTTIRLLLGLESIDQGEICFEGAAVAHRDTSNRASWLRRLAPNPSTANRMNSKVARERFRSKVGLVYQNPYASLDPRFTIFELIAEPMRAAKVSTQEISERVSELLTAVGLPQDFADRTPKRLSGGQRQRVAIARALSRNPEVLVLDEPTSALDVSVQKQILELLVGLQETRGLTYVFVTHDLAVVRGFAHKVAVMERGVIVELGDTRKVLETPSHEYTRTLLNSYEALAV